MVEKKIVQQVLRGRSKGKTTVSEIMVDLVHQKKMFSPSTNRISNFFSFFEDNHPRLFIRCTTLKHCLKNINSELSKSNLYALKIRSTERITKLSIVCTINFHLQLFPLQFSTHFQFNNSYQKCGLKFPNKCLN